MWTLEYTSLGPQLWSTTHFISPGHAASIVTYIHNRAETRTQVNLFVIRQVQQPAWRGDDDVRPPLQRRHLRSCTSYNHGEALQEQTACMHVNSRFKRPGATCHGQNDKQRADLEGGQFCIGAPARRARHRRTASSSAGRRCAAACARPPPPAPPAPCASACPSPSVSCIAALTKKVLGTSSDSAAVWSSKGCMTEHADGPTHCMRPKGQVRALARRAPWCWQSELDACRPHRVGTRTSARGPARVLPAPCPPAASAAASGSR